MRLQVTECEGYSGKLKAKKTETAVRDTPDYSLGSPVFSKILLNYTSIFRIGNFPDFTRRKMNKLLLLEAGLAFSASAVAQSQISMIARDQMNDGTMLIPQYGQSYLYSFDNSGGSIIGTPYLDTTYAKTTVRFYNNLARLGKEPLYEVNDAPIRYNLATDQVEFLLGPKDVKALNGSMIKSYTSVWPGADGIKREFVNAREIAPASALKGFLEVIVDGKTRLLAHPRLVVKKPTYNPALSTGSKDTYLETQIDYYAYDGQALTKLGGRKDVLTALKDKESAVSDFLKKEKPELKKRMGLASVFAYYNGL